MKEERADITIYNEVVYDEVIYDGPTEDTGVGILCRPMVFLRCPAPAAHQFHQKHIFHFSYAV